MGKTIKLLRGVKVTGLLEQHFFFTVCSSDEGKKEIGGTATMVAKLESHRYY